MTCGEPTDPKRLALLLREEHEANNRRAFAAVEDERRWTIQEAFEPRGNEMARILAANAELIAIEDAVTLARLQRIPESRLVPER
jgi:hypothetical protein